MENNEKQKTEIGKRFKAARKIMKMTQGQIAIALSVSEQTVRNWEHGRTPCEKHTILEWYSNKSGFTIDYLRGLVDDPAATIFEKEMLQHTDDITAFIDFLNRFSNYHFEKKGIVYYFNNSEYYPQPSLLFMEFERMKKAISDNMNNIIAPYFDYALAVREKRGILPPEYENGSILYAPASAMDNLNESRYKIKHPGESAPEYLLDVTLKKEED